MTMERPLPSRIFEGFVVLALFALAVYVAMGIRSALPDSTQL